MNETDCTGDVGIYGDFQIVCRCARGIFEIQPHSSRFQIVRQFYLLGRGEVWSSFLEESKTFILQKLTNTSQFGKRGYHHDILTRLDLQAAWDRTIRNVFSMGCCDWLLELDATSRQLL